MNDPNGFTELELILERGWYKENPLELITVLSRFSEIGRRCGLLALDDLVEKIEEPILSKILQFAVDGTDPVLINEIAENLKKSELHHRSVWLDMVIQGVLAIQAGDNPRIVAEKLGAIAGRVHMMEAGPCYIDSLPQKRARTRSKLTRLLLHRDLFICIRDETPLPDFDRILPRLDDRDFQTLLRKVDNKELAWALKRTTGAVLEKVYDNTSDRAFENLIEDMETLGSVERAEVSDAQAKILAVLEQLVKQRIVHIPEEEVEEGEG